MRSDEFCFQLLFLLTHKLNIADPTNIHEMGKPRAPRGPLGAWPPRLYKDAVDTLQQVLEEKRVEQMARHRWWNNWMVGLVGVFWQFKNVLKAFSSDLLSVLWLKIKP